MFTLEANYFCCPFWTLKKYALGTPKILKAIKNFFSVYFLKSIFLFHGPHFNDFLTFSNELVAFFFATQV